MHGIGKQLAGEESLLAQWRPALVDGLRRAGAVGDESVRVDMCFYGDLFRPAGRLLALGDAPLTAADIEPGIEQDLLFAWWRDAARTDPHVVPPDADTLARAPRSVQAALRALSRSRFFSRVALRAMVADLRQVRRYLTEPGVREETCARLAAAIRPETRVVVAHSLGSVVAYETLCTLPGHPVRALVTLGSPLGLGLVLDRLRPSAGSWPGGSLLRWTNIVDEGDVVALVKDLRPWFGVTLTTVVVHNGVHAHDAAAYLTDGRTGAAILAGLQEEEVEDAG